MINYDFGIIYLVKRITMALRGFLDNLRKLKDYVLTIIIKVNRDIIF